ncbi:hypothetical protein ON010_g6574 [Phytophthora cinnamomi]|nr:hypothetical protein ON010_g6574 [Phytophthora cinnamomi]
MVGPKKKAKAPKKTKEELEEERRLQEEEEARLRAEEEKRIEEARLKREQEAARRREENAKNRTAELERLAVEHEEAKQDLEAKAVRLTELLRAQKEAKDWDNYLACQPRPDAQVEGDMNSFLNSWQLDTATLELDLPAVTAACESATEVLEDLTFVAANACATNDDSLRAQCAQFIARLQQLVVEKVDLTTAHVLQYADEYADLSSTVPAPTSSSNVNASRGEVKLASASPNTGWVQLGLWVNLLAKGSSRNKRVEFSELGVNVDLPKAVITQSLALRVTRWPFDAFSSLSEGSDVALGGVFSLELLAVPSPPKRARGWIMREVPDAREQLKRLHYPLDGMVLSAALPIKASLTLPRDVLFAPTTGVNVSSAEVPRIGWWDATRMRWDEEGVTDVSFQEDTNSVSFSTLRLTHLALLVRRDRNYHKRSWRLCMDTNPRSEATITYDIHGGPTVSELRDMRARLTLSTAVFPRVQFEITPYGARLVEPTLPQLETLGKEVLPPGELLTRLARAGIDLCPPLEMDHEEDGDGNHESDEKQSTTRLSFAPKLKMLEDRAIDEIASVVAGFEVTDGNGNAEWGRTNGAAATRWPSAMGNNRQIVFSVKEMSWPYMTEDHDCTQQQAGDDEGINAATSAASVLILAEVDEEASGGCVKFRLDRKGESDEDTLKLAMTSREGDTETAEGEMKEEEDIYDTHVHLRRALDEISSPDARDRMDNSHVLFELTLQKMLRLLRLLSYSQPPPLRGHGGGKQGKTGDDGESVTASSSSTTNAAEATAEPGNKAQEEPHHAVAPEGSAQESGESTRQYLHVGLVKMVMKAKTEADTSAIAGKLEVAQLEKWRSDGKTATDVFKLLNLDNQGPLLLYGWNVRAWVTYVTKLDEKNADEIILSVLKPYYTESMLARVVSQGKDESADMSAIFENIILYTWLREKKSADDVFNFVLKRFGRDIFEFSDLDTWVSHTEEFGWRLKQEMWLSESKAAKDVFFQVHLNEEPSFLFKGLGLARWASYVKKLDPKNADEMMFSVLYTKKQLTKLLKAAKEIGETKDIATRLERQLLLSTGKQSYMNTGVMLDIRRIYNPNGLIECVNVASADIRTVLIAASQRGRRARCFFTTGN